MLFYFLILSQLIQILFICTLIRSLDTSKSFRGTQKTLENHVHPNKEINYKKIEAGDIMGSIQLGIQHVIEVLDSKPEHYIDMEDLMTVNTTIFQSSGTNYTPAHRYPDFIFETYAPIIFQQFRQLFGIQPDDYLISFCNSSLHELSNPGASGSIFYRTQDDKFIMKSVMLKELHFLQKLLPGYYIYYNNNPRTLLTKFVGLYSYRCISTNIRLVAMNNFLPSNIKMHQKYDLKGSTYKRKASKNEKQKAAPTFKDLDFKEHYPSGIFLEPKCLNTLLKIIVRDCMFLQSYRIIDYSLLMGVHNVDLAQKEKENAHTLSQRAEDGQFNANYYSTTTENIPIDTGTSSDEECTSPTGGILARSESGDRLLLFVGIIDVLQIYGVRKKLERWFKSNIYNGNTISIQEPAFYANRFLNFMTKAVFKMRLYPLGQTRTSELGSTKSDIGGSAGRHSLHIDERGTPNPTESSIQLPTL